ncbi:MAG: nucleotidyltransferase [Nitrososphaeria archaeon]|nr:nucleotidyltransferase [Nitrososphaeria archaeon]
MSLIELTVKVAMILNRVNLRYALVGGLACILMGVRRMTEDADFIIEAKSFDDAKRLFLELKKEGFNISFNEVKGAFRNSGHFTIIVNGFRLDFKFATSKLDFETLDRAVEVEIGKEKVKIAQLEENIAAKIVVLSSIKDLEDALWLMIHHGNKIDWNRLKLLLGGETKDVIEKILLEIEKEFEGEEAVYKKLGELRKLLKSFK